MADRHVYTVADVAEILRVSRKTIYNLIRDDNLAVVRVRGQIRITSRALDEYLTKGGDKNAKRNPRELVP